MTKLLVILIFIGLSGAHADVPAAATPTKNDEQVQVEKKSDKSIKFTHKKTKLEIFMDNINIIGKVKEFVAKMKAQNQNSIEEAESGNFSFTVKRPATNKHAKKIQDQLEKIRKEKINKYDEIN